MSLRLILGCALVYFAPIVTGEAAAPDGGKLLTADRLELVYTVRCLEQAGEGRFVRVDVARVTNPVGVPLAFQVHFQAAGKERAYLGTFALFPADNPGRFIVPTQGLLRADGDIVLTMEPLPEGTAGDAVEVWVRAVALTDGLD